MKDHEDAAGHGIYDHFMGKGSFEVVERDDGYVDISGGPKAYFRDYEDWYPTEKETMTHVRGRVLDTGCGAGRHSLYLQEKGFDVLGIDNSPLAINTCRLRGLQKAKVMSITGLSSKLGMFDTILMMGSNFGLFGSFKRAWWLLRRFNKMSCEGARIIAHRTDPYDTAEACYLQHHRLNKQRGRMSGHWRIRTGHKKYATPWFDYLLVSREEMQDILAGTGWEMERFIGTDGPRYIAAIRKWGT